MRKKGKKTIAVCIGLALAIGTLSSIFLSNNSAYKVDAADPKGDTTYIKIKNIADLSTGDEIILFNDTSDLGVTGYSGSDATTSGTEDNWMRFTVTKNSDGKSFKAYSLSLSKYVSANAANKFTIAAAESAAAPCFPTDAGVFGYTDTSNVKRYLVTNGSYNRCYKSIGSYTPFKIYLILTPEKELSMWSKTFLEALQGGTNPICKADGSTDQALLTTAWNEKATTFGKLSSSAQALAETTSSSGDTDTAKAMKLYEYCTGKYSTDVCSRFINRGSKQDSQNAIASDTTATAITITAIVVFVAFGGGYFITRKKKHQ